MATPKQQFEKVSTQKQELNHREAPGSPHHRRNILVIASLVMAGLLATGIWSRVKQLGTLKTETAQVARPTVSVVTPKKAKPAQEIILPGNVQPFTSSPIYARTNGYLKQWYADIGAHVAKGQLLAVIEAPEIDEQLAQSISNLNTAKANLALAEITKNRYLALSQTDAVSKQDVDNAVGAFNASQAIVEADQANVRQFQALQSYEKVYAPFDGVITARNTDVGDLINAGNTGNVKTDLFHIVQPGTLRVYVNVPEEFSQGIRVGITAGISLTEFPGRTFQGTLVRTSDAINLTTRTLLIEVDIGNPKGELLTGSYAEVHLSVPTQNSTYLLPVNALIFRGQGLRVGVVKDGKVSLTPITAGHDLGDEIEVVSGLHADDQVVINPPDSLVTGQEVEVVNATLPGDSK